MKRINKFALFILGALSFASCSDINDIESEGYRITGEQIDDATSVIPSRVEAKIAGMYSSMGTVCAAFPSDTRDDDGGYPTVCLSQDLNGPDMICANNGYNWFSVSSEYSDRYATYANPFARYAIFYNQIKAANDIILSIDPATASETEKYYLGVIILGIVISILSGAYVIYRCVNNIYVWHLIISSAMLPVKTFHVCR